MKKALDAANLLYPMPVTIVGAMVEGKPNFLTAAHVGILNAAKPHMVSVGLGKTHLTNAGIKETGSFSINLPGADLVVLTDHVGIHSGRKIDKSGLFTVFFGELGTAPMIQECPIAMECRLRDIYDLPTHEVFIGEIVQSYADQEVLGPEGVELARVKPLLFDMSSRTYFALGEAVAKCWNVGRRLEKDTGSQR